jgi:hypothetical protein
MRVRVPADRGRLFPSDPTRSRWWYWVAGVPIAFAFWLVAVGWVAVAVGLTPAVDPGPDGPLSFAIAVSLVALGAPLGVLVLMFPFAIYRDARAVAAADVGWQPARTRYVAAALVGPAVGVLGTLLVVAGVVGATTTRPVFAAFAAAYLLATPVALHYLRLRRRHVGVP